MVAKCGCGYPVLIRTKVLISANEESHRAFATPGLASSCKGENYIVLLFSERLIFQILVLVAFTI